jgi:hypothetical protein
MFAKCEAQATVCATPHDLIFVFNVASAAAIESAAGSPR